MVCDHSNSECLNHYETVRKYRCSDCGNVYICSCEKEFALRHLPHQVREGCVLETQERVPVTGFADNMCAECRGLPEEPHPRAAIFGQKGKVERYYWREITKSYYQLLHERIGGQSPSRSPSPAEARALRREALKAWQQIHQTAPKYDTREETEAAFLREVSVPTREIEAEYVQVERDGQRVGRWKAPDGTLVSAEELAKREAESRGFLALRCERPIVSCLVATFLGQVIQAPADPQVRSTFRASTIGWKPGKRDTPTIEIPLPEDFGTPGYWLRRGEPIKRELESLVQAPSLEAEFVSRIPATESLRDYLWAADAEVLVESRIALQRLPPHVVLGAVAWIMEHPWDRIPGWPDLLLLGDSYCFSEVKSPNDELSAEQMRWFRWACGPAAIACEIIRVRKAPDGAR